MRSLIIALLAIAALFITPANAFNELRGTPIQQLIDDTRIVVEKLSDADAAKIDEQTPPRPVEGSTMYLVKHDGYVIIALVVGGVVMISTDVVKADRISSILGRVQL